jgi:6-pyruvoyltetrahydropterin/6-carboxytetrahydropterin synthase
MGKKVAIFRKENFNSAHRLFNADWDDEKNMEVVWEMCSTQLSRS